MPSEEMMREIRERHAFYYTDRPEDPEPELPTIPSRGTSEDIHVFPDDPPADDPAADEPEGEDELFGTEAGEEFDAEPDGDEETEDQ